MQQKKSFPTTMTATQPGPIARAPPTDRTLYLMRLFAFLRIYLGVILLITVLGKLTRDAPFATEMLGFLGGVTRRGAAAWYVAFIQQVVVPHANLFSYLVMAGELVAGVSLLTGTADPRGCHDRDASFPQLHAREGPLVLVAR